MKSGGVAVKGAGVRAGLAWVAKRFGADARERLIAQLPAELQEAARSPLASSWYPIALVEHIFSAVPKLGGRTDHDGIEQLIKQMNAWIAEENLSTIYKVVLTFLTPDRLFDRMPSLFTTYYRGIEAVARRETGKKGTCTVQGLGQCAPYIAPAVAGWIEFAYRKVGSPARVTEENWERGSERADPLVFHIEWG